MYRKLNVLRRCAYLNKPEKSHWSLFFIAKYFYLLARAHCVLYYTKRTVKTRIIDPDGMDQVLSGGAEGGGGAEDPPPFSSSSPFAQYSGMMPNSGMPGGRSGSISSVIRGFQAHLRSKPASSFRKWICGQRLPSTCTSSRL